MCDFHSVIVTGDGKILHDESNSHSTIASANGLDTGLDAKWWECEWNGIGEMPSQLIQTRGKSSVPTQAAERAAERHYRKLVAVLNGDAECNETAPFNLPEYSDVRVECELRAIEAKMDEMFAPIADACYELSNTKQREVIRTLVERLGLDMAEIAADEIQDAIDDSCNFQPHYDAGYESGYESASEDMYSYEHMQEEITREVERAREETQEEVAEAYERGYKDALYGKPCELEFANGMPSFLL